MTAADGPGGLLPFDRGGGLGADVVDDAVYALDFVDDAGADAGQHFVGEAAPVGRHEVVGIHAANGDHVFVGAGVSHHAHALHGKQDGESLGRVAVEARD